jgi:hypothetical protein
MITIPALYAAVLKFDLSLHTKLSEAFSGISKSSLNYGIILQNRPLLFPSTLYTSHYLKLAYH